MENKKYIGIVSCKYCLEDIEYIPFTDHVCNKCRHLFIADKIIELQNKEFKICENCEYWYRCSDKDRKHTTEQGECITLHENLEFEISTGFNGYSVDRIFTEFDFSCNAFSLKEEIKNKIINNAKGSNYANKM